MSKSIFLFNINKNFSSLKKDNNLDIILDIFLKSKEIEFYENQFNLIIDKIDIELVKESILSYFKNKSNFIYNNDKFIFRNIYKDSKENIEFNDNYIKIEYYDKSIFLEYLSLYFVDLIAIELEDEKIYPLHLVKNNILV